MTILRPDAPLAPAYRRMPIRDLPRAVSGHSFGDWVGERTLLAPSTNAGAESLPFQRWHRFKEAFSPELIQMAVSKSPRPVRRIADPFGGSGTTALAAQFLGIESFTVEVNPFLADLISAKVASYDIQALLTALTRVARRAAASKSRGRPLARSLPPTFVEPGVKNRWLFDADVIREIARLRDAIDQETSSDVQRLFRVLLGGLIVEFSNATISGKGRRYRVNWQERRVNPARVAPAFADAVAAAIVEIDAFSRRTRVPASVVRGDCRTAFANAPACDLIVCSPPYPNSFDYTDVYNLELWVLGYLQSFDQNRELRHATLSSHVQISRDFAPAPRTPKLDRTMRALRRVQDELWDHRIPDMVGAYFADLLQLMTSCTRALPAGGQAWFVVGDSQYAGVKIKVANILADLAPQAGLKAEYTEPFRSMRVSPQQDGRMKLSEDLIVFSRS